MAATEETMLAALNVQRTAFTAELPVSAAARRDRLKRAIAMMVDHGADFAKAMSEDFGHRSIEQSMITDVIGSINPIKHTLKQLDKWMRPERRKLLFLLELLGAKGMVEYQPKGVVGIIAPWNFPVQLTIDRKSVV